MGAFGIAHLVVIVFHLFHQSRLLQVFGNLLAHLHAVHAHIQPSLLGEGTVVVEDVNGLQSVFQTQGVVVDVVRRCHFETARSELDIHIVVFYHRNLPAYEWHDDVLAPQPLVFGVVGVDAHGRVAHDGFWTRGGHNGILAGFFHDVVSQVIQFGMFVLVNHLLVTEGRLSLWIPVHHAHSAVDESLVVEVTEHLDDTLRTLLVHSERRAVPVARSAQATQLLQDDAAVLVCPVPCMLQKLIS